MPSPYWRDDFEAIGEASIAGVPFQIESVVTTNGQRKSVQRFPGTAFVRGQDLGPGDEEITVEGYIVGTDYHLVLARLKAVFDVADDKVLIDPLRGTVTVTIEGKLKVTQKPRNEGGKCTFSFACIIVPPAASSSSTTPNLANLSALGASILRSTATPALAAQLTQLSSAVPNAALVSNVSKLQTALGSAYQAVQGAITIANDLASQIDSLASDVAFAIESPTAIMTQIGGIVSQLASAPMKVASAGRTLVNTLSDGQRVAAMLGIAEFMRSSDGPNLPVLPERALADVPDEDTSPTDAALHVGCAITAIVRVELIATMLEQLATRLPESTAQAREAQAEILAAIAGVGGDDPDSLLFAVNDEIREQLVRVRTLAVNFLSSESINLPELRTYTTTGETDAIDLAFLLYGDASRWEDVVERNGLENPALVPAGTEIEYIEAA